jgi:hypothetical protein
MRWLKPLLIVLASALALMAEATWTARRPARQPALPNADRLWLGNSITHR